MPTVSRRFLVPAAIVMALAITPALTACGGNPLQNIVENATGGKLDIGGTSMPKDFPSEVPVIQGEVIFGAGIGSDTEKVWNVTVKVDNADAITEISNQLTGAGFESNMDTSSSGDAQSAIFTKEPFGVLVVVTNDDKEGFIANYTVTKGSE